MAILGGTSKRRWWIAGGALWAAVAAVLFLLVARRGQDAAAANAISEVSIRSFGAHHAPRQSTRPSVPRRQVTLTWRRKGGRP